MPRWSTWWRRCVCGLLLLTCIPAAHRFWNLLQSIRDMYAYDPEDEADDWWVEWGLLQERASKITPFSALNLEELDESIEQRMEDLRVS